MKSMETQGFVVGFAVVVGATVAPVETTGAGFVALDAVTVVATAGAVEAAVDAVVGAVVAGETVANVAVVVGGNVLDDVVVLLEHALEMTASATNPSAALLPRIVMLKG
jgi:hypothetical protein